MDFRKVGVWTATIFVGVVFLMSGAAKIMQPAMSQERFMTQWGLPPWMAIVTGLAEMTGGALVLMPRTAVYGGSIIALVMVGAAGTRAMVGELGAGHMAIIAVLGGLAALVAWFRCPWGKTD